VHSIAVFLAFLVLAASGVVIAEEITIAPLPASHRALPTAWEAADIAGSPVCGPDGSIYFVTGGYRGARFTRFDPATQRFEHLADLGSLSANRRISRSFRVTAPVVFDRRGDAWLGTMTVPAETGNERNGRLLRFSLEEMAFADSLEVAGRSVIGLGYDAGNDRLLILAAGQDTRLLGYGIVERTWTDYGAVSAGSLSAPAMAALDNGDAVIIGDGGAIYRFDAAVETLKKTDAALPAGSRALALAVIDGAACGITRERTLFRYDIHSGALNELGPIFSGLPETGEEPAPSEEAPHYSERMALFPGADGAICYAGFEPHQNLVVSCNPRTGAHALLGILSSPADRMCLMTVTGACRSADGRVYLAGSGAPGCGLYAFPPLPEETPWSTTERGYQCRHITDDSVRIDGDLADKVWQRLPPLRNFTIAQTAGAAHYATTAWLAWSDTRLYVAYRCEIDAIKAAGVERDDDIWRGECIELFLAPQGGDMPYYEIEIGPAGLVFDSRVPWYSWNEQGPMYQTWARAWNPDIRCQTQIQHDDTGKVTGWTIEASYPLAAFDGGAPRAGDVWLFDAFRIAHPAEGREEYQAWHPTYADYHKPHQFPKLVFAR